MQSAPNPVSITMFFVVIAISLVITYWAARRSTTAAQLYAAGGSITAWQNGFAIAGDLLSASLFLGGVGMFYSSGHDSTLYFFPAMCGLALMLGFIAGPLRRLGRFTFADVTSSRLSPVPMRVMATISALVVMMAYLLIQMVGAGGLIEILFGIEYNWAVVIVGGLMVTYVAFGGMLATTWVQIIKAMMLFFGLFVLTILSLAQTDFDLGALYDKASAIHKLGTNLYQPGGLHFSTAQAVSLSMAIILGLPGMPHILMRFFTVPNPHVARRSLVIGMIVAGFAYAMVFFVVGAASVAFITNNPDFMTAAGAPRGGTNMISLHLAAYLGGNVLFGVTAAVAFATILAVVAGLTVAASSSLSHDLCANVIFRGRLSEKRETMIFRAASLLIGGLAILLGIAFHGQNVLYLVGIPFAVASSACFPVLLLSIYWRRLTTAGALAGGYTGLAISLGVIVLSPSVWVAVLHNPEPIIPIDQPAIFSIPAAFIVMIVVSLLTTEKAPAAVPQAAE